MSRTTRKSAAALSYDDHQPGAAPRVVAKGYGLVADMIVQRAKEAGLYVHEAPEMVSLLMQVDLDSRIPPQLYAAVAELLAWLHRLESGAADAADTAAQDDEINLAVDAADPANAADPAVDAAAARLPRGDVPPTRWLK
ncbi:EscU/YscU/HrcU family type III secretion system export apparatus switch protein [Paraburkholderia sp. SARCC-3016]|uniref:EscU/YscU/HrcU family type III secretion system export apparatus switch protein n=1 Tax=Paraburkholderia sp. SARCC-3016 TaxID=3058611 RepID=UPI00280A42B4|nr:EscU/YscU/HrcU family type III secretion system export apparatus switch protein [Paraburkholderia sp. SARCC-3016]MDQ7979130.1 EscU/YscU/HrcU family type III secretion system export apparatus switch protein [Paraburkholderia sp. SARCC-3016]